MTLFDGLARVSRIQQAQINYEKARNNQSQTSEFLQLAYEMALSNYITAFNSQEQTANNLELSKKIYHKTLLKYKEGLVSSSELSQAGADYSQAQANNAQSIYNLLIAKTNYNRSVGN
jgi:outer membrane protein TolC